MKKAGLPFDVVTNNSSYISGIRKPSKYSEVWMLDASLPTGLNPMALLLAGKRYRRGSYPLPELGYYLGVDNTLNPFMQGFYNRSNFKDCWDGYSITPNSTYYQTYYCSLNFNMGRALMKKFTGISLPFSLPPAYETFLKELP